MNNQIISFSTPGAAWRWACNLIETLGEKVITEDGQETKEIRNLVLQVENPSTGWPISESGWNIPALEVYTQNEILSPDNSTGFDYTYGERLRAYPTSMFDDIDQIQVIINKLKVNQNTRRAVASTWIPIQDNLHEFHPPCLVVLEFLIRNNVLHMTAFFRSHDLAQAWPSNIYGLAKLLEYVANEVGIEVGSITTISASAHIYKK